MKLSRMIELSPTRSSVVVVLAGFVFFCLTGGASGNGWEHTALSFDVLVKGLAVDDVTTRTKAAQSLGVRGQPEAVPVLLARLRLPEDDAVVRSAIYEALGALGTADAMPALFECLDQETRQELRADCAVALTGAGGQAALERLIGLVEGNDHIIVRSGAVRALGGFRDDAAIDALTTVLEPDIGLYAQALRAIGLGPPKPDGGLRLRAVSALGRTGNPAAAQPLLRALAVATRDDDRLLIVRALVPLRADDAAPAFRAMIKDAGDRRLRGAATIGLATLGEADLREQLEPLLADADAGVRLAAIRGLGRHGDAAAVPRLDQMVRSLVDAINARGQAVNDAEAPRTLMEAKLVEAALRAIIDLDPAAAPQSLTVAAQVVAVNRNSTSALAVASALYQVRRTALYGLGYTGDVSVVALLSGTFGLRAQDPRLRAVATRSVGVLAPDDAGAIVVPMLRDTDADVRWTAAQVLGRLRAKSAVQPLSIGLADTDGRVRQESALALGFIGDTSPIAALQRLSQEDPSANVKAAARYALDVLDPDRK
jgi:HEAT repeat protein